MSAKTPDTGASESDADAPAFGMHHVTVVPTNFRQKASTTARTADSEREIDPDTE